MTSVWKPHEKHLKTTWFLWNAFMSDLLLPNHSRPISPDCERKLHLVLGVNHQRKAPTFGHQHLIGEDTMGYHGIAPLPRGQYEWEINGIRWGYPMATWYIMGQNASKYMNGTYNQHFDIYFDLSHRENYDKQSWQTMVFHNPVSKLWSHFLSREDHFRRSGTPFSVLKSSAGNFCRFLREFIAGMRNTTLWMGQRNPNDGKHPMIGFQHVSLLHHFTTIQKSIKQ